MVRRRGLWAKDNHPEQRIAAVHAANYGAYAVGKMHVRRGGKAAPPCGRLPATPPPTTPQTAIVAHRCQLEVRAHRHERQVLRGSQTPLRAPTS